MKEQLEEIKEEFKDNLDEKLDELKDDIGDKADDFKENLAIKAKETKEKTKNKLIEKLQEDDKDKTEPKELTTSESSSKEKERKERDKKKIKKEKSIKRKLIVLIIVIVLVIAVVVLLQLLLDKPVKQDSGAATTPIDVIKIAELRTFKIPFSSVATIDNDKKLVANYAELDDKEKKKVDKKVLYHLRYEGTAVVWCDAEEITYEVDKESKAYIVKLPELKCTVEDVELCEKIYVDKKAEKNYDPVDAIKFCEKDAQNKLKDKYIEIGESNLKSLVRGFLKPFMLEDYDIIFE